jgi:hypothetical protein
VIKILGCVFDYNQGDRYQRLADVWEYSIHKAMPKANVTLVKMPTPKDVKRNSGFTSNHEKFKYWKAFIDSCDDGDHVVLMDVDTYMRQSIADAFDHDFDIGLTKRTAMAFPYNGGVVFVKVNDRSRRFIEFWSEIDYKMYHDKALHDPYRQKYRGQNQAALGYCLEHNDTGAVVAEFRCSVYNACNDDWLKFCDVTRVVHVKSNLRRACLGETGIPSKLKPIVVEWRKLEKECDTI